MSFLENYGELKEEYKSQGIKEGIERSKKDSYNQGFKEGVMKGIEKGMLLSFISTAKKILETNENENKNSKLLKMIDNIQTDKFEELERKVKVLKTNIILMNKNKNKDEKNSE